VKRIPVWSKTTEEFSPLDVALQEMQQRTLELGEVCAAQPPDLKRLQLKLQGAVQATVNAGPIAYAEAFTTPEQTMKYGVERIHQLKEDFRYGGSLLKGGLEGTF